MPSSSSTWIAYFSSLILRPRVCWVACGDLVGSSPASSTKTFFTYCWVRVDAPCADAAALRVAVERAQDALEVDRAVLVEAGVLDRDDRLLHVRRDVLEVDHRAVTRVDRGDRAALGVEDRGALAQRWRLEVGREFVETLDRTLGGQPQRADGGQRDTGQHGSREHTDTEELGGLLRSTPTERRMAPTVGPNRADRCEHMGRQPTLPFARTVGQAFAYAAHDGRSPFPGRAGLGRSSTVTAVRPRIKRPATLNRCGGSSLFWWARVRIRLVCHPASVVTQRELSRFAGKVTMSPAHSPG